MVIFVHGQWQCCVSVGFLTPLSFLPVSSSLQICTTQLVGSKVLYTRKYYTRVEKSHLYTHGEVPLHTPQVTVQTQHPREGSF